MNRKDFHAPKIPKKEVEKVIVTRSVFWRRAVTFRNILLGLIIGFATLTFFVKQFDYFKFDLGITLAIQNFRPGWFDFLMVWTSRLGDVGPGTLSINIFTVISLLARKWRTALMIFVTSFTMTILNQAFKFLVARPRPDASLVDVVGYFKRSDSFPSGHTMFYVGLYGFLIFIVYTQFRKDHWLRPTLLTLFSAMIILGGMSRIYLGAHWFSDVLGAYLLGSSWLMVMIWVYNKTNPKVRPSN